MLQYWRNIAFTGQFAPMCSILDQYYANIACYTGIQTEITESHCIGLCEYTNQADAFDSCRGFAGVRA